MYLVAYKKHNAETVQGCAIWNQLRRYNLPVQCSVTAAYDVAKQAQNPQQMALVSLAPCQVGSPELYNWVHKTNLSQQKDKNKRWRINPVHTLHAVDNLALSVFAIMHNNRDYCIGLGGAAGQAWNALEIAQRLINSSHNEVLLMAGDQNSIETGENAKGIALLFSADPKPYKLGRFIRVMSITRSCLCQEYPVQAHAVNGLIAFISALDDRPKGSLSYRVPFIDGDTTDKIAIEMEIE